MALTIEQEQRAFDGIRDRLLVEHRGEVVLFKDGAVAGFFQDHAAAYRAGLKKFGTNALFLVAAVAPMVP